MPRPCWTWPRARHPYGMSGRLRDLGGSNASGAPTSSHSGARRSAHGWQVRARALLNSARCARSRSRADPRSPVHTRNAGSDTACRASVGSSRPAHAGGAAGFARPRYSEGLRAWLSQRRTQRRERDRGAVPLDAARQAGDDVGAPVVRRARRAAAGAPDAGERFTRRVAVESAQAERGSRGRRCRRPTARSTSLSSESPDRTRGPSGCSPPRR